MNVEYRIISSDTLNGEVSELTIQRKLPFDSWSYYCTVKRGNVTKRSLLQIELEAQELIKAFRLRDTIIATIT